MGAEMLKRLHDKNSLKERIIQYDLAKNSKWKSYDATDCDFPELSEDQLRDLTFGIFQLRQAKSYVAEHLEKEKSSSASPGAKNFFVELCDEQPDIVRVKYQSRFTNAKTRISYIQFDENKKQPIVCCYCTCSAGSRTIGCCSHSAATLWYLGYQRHLITPSYVQTSEKYFDHVEASQKYSAYSSSSEEDMKYTLGHRTDSDGSDISQ
ncbi:unnamed protein product [Didymodactylos carnosus]|uniref:SWIM-type domain-containing protein n=1 Tax=Didymodactylos carnosus TaxID=1234261 RepID=A0A814I1F5_9BILA|nr:unnamed protein product [Didymodactylos carnosus]CAF3790593.1 unnamed protein product [Didymodactylos carnosus]